MSAFRNGSPAFPNDDISIFEALSHVKKKEKRPNRGGGSKISSIFYNIDGKSKFGLSCKVEEFSKHGVLFFCETWITENKPTPPLIDGKDCFVSFARQPLGGRGRPSGGLEMYVSSSLCASLLSKSPNHIAVLVGSTAVIGVYYPPGTDMDDISSDVLQALNECRGHEIVIGGDWNLKVGENNFSCLSSLLANENITLRSNPQIPTYYHSKGSSSPDHVYTSSKLISPTCNTLNIQDTSPHQPIQVVFKTQKQKPPSKVMKRFLHIPRCTHLLENLNLSKVSEPLWASSIQEIFMKSSSIRRSRKKLRKNPWFGQYHHDLQNIMRSNFNAIKADVPGAHAAYTTSRIAYQKALKFSRKNHACVEVENLIASARANGLKSVFKAAKSYSSTCSEKCTSFLSYCKGLFGCSSSDTGSVPIIPSCEQENHPLLNKISQEEVHQAIQKQKSKASSLSGLSPMDIKAVSDSITPLLTSIYDYCLNTSTFFSKWLNASFFFIFKKGSKSDPNNYRSIAVQDPFLKIFSSVLTNRIKEFAEKCELFPTFQFGFRSKRSTTTAAALLNDIVSSRLKAKKRTYVAYVDFKKAFDHVHRPLLFKKLQILGFPLKFCSMLSYLYKNTQCFVKSGDFYEGFFNSQIGLPQGDPSSPAIFNLFLADLPNALQHQGVSWNGIYIKYLQYADDLAIIADSPEDLQIALDCLADYCSLNKLQVNVNKTKVQIFHKGRLPGCSFFLNGRELEKVRTFCYLGFDFTVQLSSSSHVDRISSKARSKIGFLFHQLPLSELPIGLVLEIFQVFVTPIFLYGLPIWISKCSTGTMNQINSVFTKFLKRYLQVPPFSNNATIYYITDTQPLVTTLITKAPHLIGSLVFPSVCAGANLSFLQDLADIQQPEQSPSFKLVPSEFWLSKTFHALPKNAKSRRNLCREILDLDHYELCKTPKFHPHSLPTCVCKFCNEPAHYYHMYSCKTIHDMS